MKVVITGDEEITPGELREVAHCLLPEGYPMDHDGYWHISVDKELFKGLVVSGIDMGTTYAGIKVHPC